MTDSEETSRECYFRLLALSQAPEARLRQPRSTWSEADHAAASIIELLSVIDATLFRYDDAAVAARLARVTPLQVARFDAALLAIGATQQRRILGVLQRVLVASVEPSPNERRESVIAERLTANDHFVHRFKYDISSDEIAQALCAFLDGSADRPLPPLPPYEAPVTEPIWPLVPTPAPRVERGNGRHHLFVLRDDEPLKALLDEWIGMNPATRHFDETGTRPVASYSAALHFDRNMMWGPLSGAVVGERHTDETKPIVLRNYWKNGGDQRQAAALDSLSSEFRWALFQWNIDLSDCALALLSDDEAIASRFDTLLRESGVIPIASFHRFVNLTGTAGGLSFLENDAIGEAALVAADMDKKPLWLVVSAREHRGYWWCETSTRLDPQAWHWTCDLGQELMLIVYRGDDRGAWRELWSRIGSNDSVAVTAVSGHVPIDVLRERLVRTKDHFRPDNLRYVAGNAWAYAHVWGGGADEHSAVFYSHDPEVTQRVGEFAARQWPDRRMYLSFW